MQLVYGNDGQNYTTIAKSAEITEEQERRLLESYRGYGYVKNRELYSDASKEPVSLSYASTDILGSKKKIMLVKNARMSNYTTPCSYTHIRFFDAVKENYGRSFLEFLQVGFVADRDLNLYKKQNIDTLEIPNEDYVPNQHALMTEQLYTLVAALLYAADSYVDQLKVIVDIEGDDYNHRALDVIASVYQYIPYHVRMTAGFSTYADPMADIPDRIKFQLYTREAQGKVSGLVIDLSEGTNRVLPGYVTDDIREFAKMIVDMPEEEREDLFRYFQETFAQENATVRDHILLYKNKDEWLKEPDEAEWKEWIGFADSEEKNGGDSAIFHVFCKLFSRRAENEKMQESYREYLQKILKNWDTLVFNQEMWSVFHFTEWIDGLDYNLNDFQEWMQRNVIEKSEQTYEDERDQEKFLTEKKKEWLKNALAIGKFKKVCDALTELLDHSLSEVKYCIHRKKTEEAVQIAKSLMSEKWNLDNLNKLEKMYQSIVYDVNRDFFSTKLAEEVINALKNQGDFQTVREYDDCCLFVEKCKKMLLLSSYQKLSEMVGRKGSTILEMEAAKLINWLSREEIFESYWNLVMLEQYMKGNDNRTCICCLQAADQIFKLELKEIEALLDFIVSVTSENENKFTLVIQKDEELLRCLMKLRAFGPEHFEALFRVVKQVNPKLKKSLISYYLHSGVLLSKKKVEDVIGDESSDVLKTFRKEKTDTILGLAISGSKKSEPMKVIVPIISFLMGIVLGIVGAYFIILK